MCMYNCLQGARIISLQNMFGIWFFKSCSGHVRGQGLSSYVRVEKQKVVQLYGKDIAQERAKENVGTCKILNERMVYMTWYIEYDTVLQHGVTPLK